MHYLIVPANTGDHTTSCYVHFPSVCIPLCHKNCARVRVARPSLRVLVMQYIQRCGGSGLVHETRESLGTRLSYVTQEGIVY